LQFPVRQRRLYLPSMGGASTDDRHASSGLRAATPEVTPELRNVRTIAGFEGRALASRSLGERVVDAAARIIGTTTFAVLHLIWFGVWIILNVGIIRAVAPFDPFPFSLLTLVVSLEAIFLSLVLVISQNRITRQTEKRAHLDLQINLLAEEESSKALQLLVRIAERVGVEEVRESGEIDKLAAKTDVDELADEVEGKIPEGA
jgi:uncharacterized membrane protein